MTTLIASALAIATTTTDLDLEILSDAELIEEGPEGPAVEAAPEAPAKEPKAKKAPKEPKAPRAKKEPKPKRPYPFATKNQIAADIESSTPFALACLQIMQSRQTSAEEETKATISKNARGWMSSQAKRGTELATKARNEGLTVEETEQARALVSRYTKQLAEHFRAEQIAANPELADIAALFSAD
jgi:outer membrane biosynthesis protein TonB